MKVPLGTIIEENTKRKFYEVCRGRGVKAPEALEMLIKNFIDGHLPVEIQYEGPEERKTVWTKYVPRNKHQRKETKNRQ